MAATFCNPLDLPYRYQIKIAPGKKNEKIFREAADPTLILFKDTYLLFASMSAGFWYSDDMVSWQFKATPELPCEDYAPDVREIDGQVVFCASKRGAKCTFFRSADPVHEPFEPVATTLEFWDPDLFQDDDGRVYLYWGCDSKNPTYGVELNRETFEPLGEPVAIVTGAPARHGWERKGENNHMGAPKSFMEGMIRLYTGTKPFVEGSYMTKNQGLYYYQYAAPGTESNIYADGVYVGKSPLGPFEYQEWNPFSQVPGGFMTGTGHGSTFQDKAGNWWHAATMRISVNENFERRVGIFPCFFDEEGTLWCDQRFATYPQELPEGKRAFVSKPAAMLISRKASVRASSAEAGHGPELCSNEDCRSFWAASANDVAPWLELDLGKVCEMRAVQLNMADYAIPESGIPEEDFVDSGAYFKRIIKGEDQELRYVLEASLDGASWDVLLDTSDGKSDRPHAYVELGSGAAYRYVRVRDIVAPLDGRAAVSGLRVFGVESGTAPAQVGAVNVRRTEKGLSAKLSWQPAQGAEGYNVRYGLAPDKLYGCWEVNEGTSLRLSTLDAGKHYFCVIDSFNGSGTTPGSVFEIEA